jgi:hypothetical protein
LETPQGEFKPFTRTLLEKKKLKNGFLFLCPDCGRQWYLDGAREMMTVVPENKMNLIEKWTSFPLVLPPSLWAKAKLIGATPAHRIANEPHYAEVPCRVTTLAGDPIDKCLLLFSDRPPLETLGKAMGLINDIADITPSEYALPLAVRTASGQSQETRTGSALTPVESEAGVRFNLNWTVNFFDKKGIRGKDLRLSAENPVNKTRRYPIINEPLEAITFFLGDFDETTSDLFNP